MFAWRKHHTVGFSIEGLILITKITEMLHYGRIRIPDSNVRMSDLAQFDIRSYNVMSGRHAFLTLVQKVINFPFKRVVCRV